LRLGVSLADVEKLIEEMRRLGRENGLSAEAAVESCRAECDQLRAACGAFLDNQSGKSAADLEALAERLHAPGSMHNAGRLVDMVRSRVPLADPLLVAATMYSTWKGGRVGFQFLPNPQETEPEAYDFAVADLVSSLGDAYDDPRAVLTGVDREFFDSLTDRFTVYRGGYGMPAKQLARGVCWTTSRPIAEWFANRSPGNFEPVLVSGRISKKGVALAFNSECEIVCMPRPWRALKCPPPSNRPPMAWRKTE
jgi:hypothetical protein